MKQQDIIFRHRPQTFRVSVLQPIAHGRARVLESWITNAEGALEALDAPGREHLAIQIELENWEETAAVGPWLTQSWASPRAKSLQ